MKEETFGQDVSGSNAWKQAWRCLQYQPITGGCSVGIRDYQRKWEGRGNLEGISNQTW